MTEQNPQSSPAKPFRQGGSSVIFRFVMLFLFERGGGMGSPWALPKSLERARKRAWYHARSCWFSKKNNDFSCISVAPSLHLAKSMKVRDEKWSPPSINHKCSPGATIFALFTFYVKNQRDCRRSLWKRKSCFVLERVSCVSATLVWSRTRRIGVWRLTFTKSCDTESGRRNEMACFSCFFVFFSDRYKHRYNCGWASKTPP